MGTTLPRWVLPVIGVLGVLVLTGVVWKSLTGRNEGLAPVGKDLTVRPGMYDMRAEMQKPRPKP
jgi:hypothetical protein